jgi:hypothetical protein
MIDLIVRFLIGGAVVSAFALIGDVLRPKSFAGLFGAAPSVALATIGLTISANGIHYAAVEARSMTLGAVAFFVYTICVCRVLMRHKPSALLTTTGLMFIWAATSFCLWYFLARSS